MNNKGQTLVIFILMLPIIITLIAYVYDMSGVLYETSKLNNIAITTIRYGLEHMDSVDSNKLNELIKKNDSLKDIRILFKDETIQIVLTKEVQSTFGNLIGIKTFKIKSDYTGSIESGKKIIVKTKERS